MCSLPVGTQKMMWYFCQTEENCGRMHGMKMFRQVQQKKNAETLQQTPKDLYTFIQLLKR